MNPLPGNVNRATEKVAKPIKPAVEHVPKPVEDAKVPKPQNSVTAANGGVRTPLAHRKPTAPKAQRTDKFNHMTDKFVKPDRFEKMARPPGSNNDVLDTKATGSTMDKMKLIKTFQAEQAALRAFRELSTTEVAAYTRANPVTVFAENAGINGWWNSLTPKQKAGYLKLHPNSKLAKQAGFNGAAERLAHKTSKVLRSHLIPVNKSVKNGITSIAYNIPEKMGTRSLQSLHKSLTGLGYNRSNVGAWYHRLGHTIKPSYGDSFVHRY